MYQKTGCLYARATLFSKGSVLPPGRMSDHGTVFASFLQLLAQKCKRYGYFGLFSSGFDFRNPVQPHSGFFCFLDARCVMRCRVDRSAAECAAVAFTVFRLGGLFFKAPFAVWRRFFKGFFACLYFFLIHSSPFPYKMLFFV